MKKSALAALAVALMAVAIGIGQPVAVATFGWVIGRYPGSARITSEDVEPGYLRRGWLSRHSVFETESERGIVEHWYLERYGPVSEDEAYVGENCSGFRTSKLLVRIVYAVSITLCSVPVGTRIVVNESAFFSPPPARRPAP